MLPKYTTYRGKQLKVMTFDDAIDEFNAQKTQGKKPVVVSTPDGYIVTDAMFEKEGGEKNVT